MFLQKHIASLTKSLKFLEEIRVVDEEELLVAVRVYRGSSVFCLACTPGFEHCVAIPLGKIPQAFIDRGNGCFKEENSLDDDTYLLFSTVPLARGTIDFAPEGARRGWVLGVLVLDKPINNIECKGFRFLMEHEQRALSVGG